MNFDRSEFWLALNNIRFFAMGSEDDLMISWQRTKTLLFEIVIINRIMSFYKLECSFSAHNSWPFLDGMLLPSRNRWRIFNAWLDHSPMHQNYHLKRMTDLIGRSITKFFNRQQATKIIHNENDRKANLLMSFVKFTFEFKNRNPNWIERRSYLFSYFSQIFSI